jgi:drug/metabolite transporter (DMT)-like permease
MNAPSNPPHLPRTALVLVVSVALAWGFNWPLLKIVLAEMAPLHFRTWCVVGGAAGLFAIAAAGRRPLAVPRGQWTRLLAVTFFNVTAWNVLVAYGVELMDSGRASILGFTMPVWGVLLGRLFFGEPLSTRHVSALGLGIAGLAFLLGGEFSAAGRSPLGASLMLAAAALWAVGVVLMKRWGHLGMPATVFTAWQLLLGSIPIVLAVPLEDGSFSPLRLGTGALLALAYTVAVAFVFCYWAWNRAVAELPVVVSSLSSLLVPLVGVFSGMLLLGERPGWTDFSALALITGAVATVLVPAARASGPAASRAQAGPDR